MSSTAPFAFRLAGEGDIEAVLPMMREFWAFERLPFVEQGNRELLRRLVSSPDLGRLVLIEGEGRGIGYVVIGFGFSVEFGGRDALIDELFVRGQHRGRGAGAAALEFSCEMCRRLGIGAVHLEVDHFNERAHRFYVSAGFKDHSRHLMTRWLAE